MSATAPDLASRIEAAVRGGSPDPEGLMDDEGIDIDIDVADLAGDILPRNVHEHDEAPDPSEDDPDLDGEDTDGPEDGPHSDEPEGTRPTSYSRLLRQRARDLSELSLERESRARLETELTALRQELRDSRQADPTDVVDLVRDFLRRELGAQDASDPRVQRALEEAVTELTVEAYPDAAKNEESLARVQREREARRTERERTRVYDERVRRLELENERHRAEAALAGLRDQAQRLVTESAERLRFLSAAAAAGDIVPADFILKAARHAVATGQEPDPQDEGQLRALYSRIALRLDGHYQALAGRLTPSTAPSTSVKRRPSGDLSVRGAAVNPVTKDNGHRHPRPSRGGGGRATIPANHPDSDDTSVPERLDLTARIERAQRLARRDGRGRQDIRPRSMTPKERR